jgi:hypothetical protein
MLRLINGATVEPRSVDWAWRYWLAYGKLHLLVGAPGTAKTTIDLAVAAAITTGGKWPDGTQAPLGNVVIWSGEDDFNDTLLPRFMAMGGDPSRIFVVGAVRVGGECRAFDPALDMKLLRDQALKIGNVSLLMIDPIVSAVAGDSHKNAEVRRGLQQIVDLATQLNAVVLGISHYSKGTSGNNPVERVTGSIAFSAVARVIFGVARVEDSDDRVFVRVKSNIGPDGGGFKYTVEQRPVPGYPGIDASTIVWGDPMTGSARTLLKEAETDREPTKLEQCSDKILDLIEAKGLSRQILATELKAAILAAGFGENTFYQALKRLPKLQKKKANGDPHGELVYALPESSFQFFAAGADSAPPQRNDDLQ